MKLGSVTPDTNHGMNMIGIIGGSSGLLLIITLSVAVVWLRKRKPTPTLEEAVPLTTEIFNVKEVPIQSLIKGISPFPTEEEFARLEELDKHRCNNNTDYQGRKANKAGNLNRHKDILPFDQTRVVLKILLVKVITSTPRG